MFLMHIDIVDIPFYSFTIYIIFSPRRKYWKRSRQGLQTSGLSCQWHGLQRYISVILLCEGFKELPFRTFSIGGGPNVCIILPDLGGFNKDLNFREKNRLRIRPSRTKKWIRNRPPEIRLSKIRIRLSKIRFRPSKIRIRPLKIRIRPQPVSPQVLVWKNFSIERLTILDLDSPG